MHTRAGGQAQQVSSTSDVLAEQWGLSSFLQALRFIQNGQQLDPHLPCSSGASADCELVSWLALPALHWEATLHTRNYVRLGTESLRELLSLLHYGKEVVSWHYRRSETFCKCLAKAPYKTKLHSKNQLCLTGRLSVNESRTHSVEMWCIFMHILWNTWIIFYRGDEQNWK